MPLNPAQPTLPPETVQTPVEEPQSVPVLDTTAIQDSTGSVSPGTTISEPAIVPLEAVEAPTSTSILASGQTLVSEPISQNQASAPVPTPTMVPQTQEVSAPTNTVYIPVPNPNPRSFLSKALETIQFRKKAKLEKIMKFAGEKKNITNDQVEKLLHVSDATAARYLLQLVKSGRLQRIGKDGSSRYEPINGSNPTN